MTQHTHNTAVDEIIEDRANWDTTGKFLFQNILESIFIEVEDEIAAKEKAEKEELIDSTMDAEVDQIMQQEKWEDVSDFTESEISEDQESHFQNPEDNNW